MQPKIKAKITAILAEKTTIPKEEVRHDTMLSELQFDSLDMVEVLISIESEFEVHIKDFTLDQYATVDDFMNAIEKNCPALAIL